MGQSACLGCRNVILEALWPVPVSLPQNLPAQVQRLFDAPMQVAPFPSRLTNPHWPIGFEVHVRTLSGGTLKIKGLGPDSALSELRAEIGVELGIHPCLLCLILGVNSFTARELGMSLEDLGIGSGTELTCIQFAVKAKVVGGRCYVCTEQRVHRDEDALSVVHAQYGADANIASLVALTQSVYAMDAPRDGARQMLDLLHALDLQDTGAYLLQHARSSELSVVGSGPGTVDGRLPLLVDLGQDVLQTLGPQQFELERRLVEALERGDESMVAEAIAELRSHGF